MSKESFGILSGAGASVVFLALYLIDRSGRALPPIVSTGLLCLMALLSLSTALLLIPWFWAPRLLAEKIWRVSLVSAVILLMIGRFGIWLGFLSESSASSVVSTVSNTGDQVSHIEDLLADVQDPAYRQLVAAVIHAFEPKASLAVGSLLNTPDGTRKIDVEVRSPDNSKLTAIDIVDLPVGQKAGIEFIDAADSKRRDIKADVMLLCSNTGFDDIAIKKAKREKIGLISVLRQDDKRVKAVIEEQIYLRRVNVDPMIISYEGDGPLQGPPAKEDELRYKGGSVDAWLSQRAEVIIFYNPDLQESVLATFNLKVPTNFDFATDGSRTVKLKSLSIEFHPHVQWLSQTVQIDAKTGIYDYVRGRVKLAAGNNSYIIRGVDFDHADPLPSPPPIADRPFGLLPGEIDVSLAIIDGVHPPPKGISIADLEDIVRPEDLESRIPKR